MWWATIGGHVTNYNFESLNFPNHFIRHLNFQGELTTFGGSIQDFAFSLVRRASGQVALRSTNFRDRFLFHRDFRIWLEGPSGPGDQLFRQDSTFSSSAALPIQQVSRFGR